MAESRASGKRLLAAGLERGDRSTARGVMKPATWLSANHAELAAIQLQ